jgi:hypothetical protein
MEKKSKKLGVSLVVENVLFSYCCNVNYRTVHL